MNPSSLLLQDNLWKWMQAILVIVVVVLGVSLRILPGLVLGVPYLPDPWVHIAKADKILLDGYFNILGDYDDHWPGLNILIALFADFLGLDTITISRTLIPLVCSFSLLLSFLLFRRLLGNDLIALVGLLLLSFAAPLTLIMGTTYKEGLARLLLVAALFAFTVRTPNIFVHNIPVVVLLGVIIPVHHISFLVAGSGIIFVILSLLVFDHRTGLLSRRSLLLYTFVYLSVFGIAFAYYLGFGCFDILLLDFRILGIGLVTYFILFGLLNLRRIRATQTHPAIKVVLLLIALAALSVFLANLVFIPTFPLTLLPVPTLLLLFPLVFMMLLAGLGLVSLDRVSPRTRIFLSSWVYAILGLLLFALLSGQASINLILTYRLFIFLLAPVAALGGVAVFAYYTAHPHRARALQALLILSLLAVLPVTTLAYHYDPFFGYGCSITPPIQASNHWIATSSSPQDLIVGDHLFTYYLLYYLDHPAFVDSGVQLFVDGNRTTHFTIAALHRYMYENGFWLPSGVQWAPIHPDIPPWLTSDPSHSLIYNNGLVQLYKRL